MLEIMSNDDFEPEEGNCLRFIVGTSDTYVAKIYFLWMFHCCKSKVDFMSIPHFLIYRDNVFYLVVSRIHGCRRTLFEQFC